MKRYILLILLFCSTFQLIAQIDARTIYTRASGSFSYRSEPEQKVKIFTGAVDAGYFIKNNYLIGVSFGFVRQKLEIFG